MECQKRDVRGQNRAGRWLKGTCIDESRMRAGQAQRWEMQEEH
jgi:hypothetical protein